MRRNTRREIVKQLISLGEEFGEERVGGFVVGEGEAIMAPTPSCSPFERGRMGHEGRELEHEERIAWNA